MCHQVKRNLATVLATALIAPSLGLTAVADEPNGYMIGLVTVTNKDWVAKYRPKNAELLKKHGGRILVRGKPAEVLEGAAPNAHTLVVVEFPSMESARAWYNDPDYGPLRRLRQTGSNADFILMEQWRP